MKKKKTGTASGISSAARLAQLLANNHKEELRGLMDGIGGLYVLPGVGGDIIRVSVIELLSDRVCSYSLTLSHILCVKGWRSCSAHWA